jgi:MarR family transcriptional regulator for hemolysin
MGVTSDSEPIGLEIARTGRMLNRAFDDVLVGAGGSLPIWLITTALKRGDHTMQRDIAGAIGIEGATLTHHLHRMERAGVVSRHREVANRRNQLVSLTAEGDALFDRMLSAVVAFDRRLRQGLTSDELERLRTALDRLRANAAAALADDASTR